ncbi:glycosyltransferase [Ramlibacter sp. XY19]|uniref:glycosyltransferase n=1 Tax=Ramlibacter paludis TaxID=2908000 RepID=UPI0023DA5386|nr:glycosyltransferase [Ramlibacter paludis]MCG2591236.1 glycosyltransferase [Ramlibacter paludis]
MKKILFVAMQMSTHTVRWINQLSDAGYDIHLFPVNHLPAHPDLRGVTIHQPFPIARPRHALKQWAKNVVLRLMGRHPATPPVVPCPVGHVYGVPVLTRWMPYLNARRMRLGESDQTAPVIYGPRVLGALIRKLRPDLIHSLEFQHCGYLVLAARDLLGADGFPKWLATNWGSDIYYYRQLEGHRQQISRLLRSVDYYSCECERDVGMARELGLTAPVMPVMPNTGGFNVEVAARVRFTHQPSKRKLIMVKGYQHFAGRAMVALEAIERCADLLKGYQVIVYTASPEIHGRVDELREWLKIDIRLLHHVPHDYMLRMFSRARIYLGVSASDAISTSLLEAMAMGAFPIQTNTSCCNEWIQQGVTGMEIPQDNPHVIADCLRQALQNDALVDDAATLNWTTVVQRLDERILREKAKAYYATILQGLPAQPALEGQAGTTDDSTGIAALSVMS